MIDDLYTTLKIAIVASELCAPHLNMNRALVSIFKHDFWITPFGNRISICILVIGRDGRETETHCWPGRITEETDINK